MIRKMSDEIGDDERVLTATKSVTVRKDGEKLKVVKGEQYIVSGDYDCFQEVKENGPTIYA